MIFGKWRFGVR